MTPDSPIGSIIGGCRIDAAIGHGGMGVVYRAEQLSLRRRVALKLLPSSLSHDPEFRARFEQEAQIAASLDHQHVVPIFDYGDSEGQLFIVMRYVDGTDLRALLRAGPLSPQRATRIVAQLGAALDAAHGQGLVHRDVKPGNVLLRSDAGGDHVYLSDFGLTKVADESRGLTRTGQWLGTPDYAAPEQIEGRRVDARTDVYALGCLLYEMLTGAAPFPRDNAMASLWAHVNESPPRPSERARSIPEAFDAIVARALAKDPDERYASAGDLGRAALAAAEGRVLPREDRSVATGEASPVAATVPTRRMASVHDRAAVGTHVQPPAARSSRRTPLTLALAALILVAGGALAATLLAQNGSSPTGTHTGAGTPTSRAHGTPETVTSDRPAPAAPVTTSPDATTAAPTTSRYHVSRQQWTAYASPVYHVDRPVGWAMQKDFHPENSIRSRSEWTDPVCGCELVIDYIAGYGESALENASETPGGTKEPASIGVFDDAALRLARGDAGHEATYFVVDGTDNYAVRATAPAASTALELARRTTSSLLPFGE